MEIPANNPDTGAAITKAVQTGERSITLAAGYHKFLSPGWLPVGTKIIAFGAHCELVGYGFTFDGPAIEIKGGTFFGKDGVFGVIGGHASIVSLERATVDCKAVYTSLTLNATACSFGKPPGSDISYPSGFRDGIIDNCHFTDIDTYVGGSITFRNNTMHNSRLVSDGNLGGLNKATFSNIRWSSKRSLINQGECFLFETCNVTDCTFDNFRLENCAGPLFMFYGWGSAFNFTGNNLTNLVSTGPTAFGIFLLSNGTIANNSFTGISMHRVMYPIMLGKGVKASNRFDKVYINDVTPVVPSDGFYSLEVDVIASYAKLDDSFRRFGIDTTDPLKRYIITDMGDERAQIGAVHVNKGGGTPVCNRTITPPPIVRA